MNRRHTTVLGGVAAAALALTLAPMSAQAAHPAAAPAEKGNATQPDDRSHPLGDAQRELRAAAVDKLVAGEAKVTTKNGKKVIAMSGKDPKGKTQSKYVQYDVNRTANVFTVLAEFGDQTMPAQGGTPGPLHNQIAEPDRNWDGSATDDNSTIWAEDFNRAHYENLMFGEGESFRDFFQKQSNGRFMTNGDVSDWVKLPYNEARYGHNPVDGDGTSEGEQYWSFVKDTAEAWYQDQLAQGKTAAQVKEYLKQFDVWDRYDHDGDGNFDEPDGYIDHFQAIHAGEGEEAGGGAEGEDAIWSHRWYAFPTQIGKTGPDTNKLGGVPLGDSGIWIGDYTTEPENGGLGVFVHEFSHDLGLPDFYDTAGGDNGTGFWTLMSSGSWLNDGTEDIGSKPGYMGPWEKLQLGWLDYQAVAAGTKTTTRIGPADRDHRKLPQALAVTLPKKTVRTDYNTPHSGATEWWSGSADDLNNHLARSVDLTGKSSASMSAWISHEIEEGYDFLVVEASTDGTSWQQVGEVIDGGDMSWKEYTFDLSAYAGQKVDVRFRYQTDGGLHLKGAFIDDITITADGATVLSDDVESGDNGWTAKGFTRMGGSTSEEVSHYYLAENRVYAGYDRYLKTGPYNFGWASTRPDWVERFPYQNGLLVWYVDNAYGDNNTSQHPGHGLALPVDARPAPVTFPDGRLLGNRRQVFDATFGLERTDAVTFHRNGVPSAVPSQPAMPVFDDSNPDRYWSAKNPWSSTKVAGSGTTIEVKQGTGDEMTLRVDSTR